VNFRKWFLCVISSIILMTFQVVCNASSDNSKGVVNILSWFNYLNSPEIVSMIKDKCDVKISYDEYYSSSECFKRLSNIEGFYYYDIIIFPNDIYELIKTSIKMENSDLNNVVKDYSSSIKSHYLLRGYPSNVVYFALSLSGFIWNPAIIELRATDSMTSMFKKANDNIVIIINSYIGLWSLINNKNVSDRLFVERFRKTIQDADIYITNGYNKLYSRDNFVFAFQRSGDAIFAMKATKNKTLAFLWHPKYSYVVPDLMAELNARSETRCVARVLASKEALDVIQKKTYYLSPYGTHESVNDSVFQNVYKQLFDNAYKVLWLDPFFVKGAKWYFELHTIWEKIHMLPQVAKNKSLVLRSRSGWYNKRF
jgi:spermidine/putrescine-binding protein